MLAPRGRWSRMRLRVSPTEGVPAEAHRDLYAGGAVTVCMFFFGSLQRYQGRSGDALVVQCFRSRRLRDRCARCRHRGRLPTHRGTRGSGFDTRGP